MTHPSLRATTNEFATDTDPQATDRAIVDFLARKPWSTAGAIHRALYGTSLVGASQLNAALGRLRNRKLVHRGADRTFVLTAAGHLWQQQWSVFDGGEPA